MKNFIKCAALSFAALSSLPCSAQTNVQVYGIVDAGLEYSNNVRSGGLGSQSNSITRIQSGNAASSRIGFRGKEDLGDGYSALFVLENGFTVDTGGFSNGGRLFGRQSFVGVNGPYGELQLGRQTTSIYDFSLIFDPVAPARYSTLVFDPAFVGRADNALKYIGKFGNFSVRTQYSLGFDSTIVNSGELAEGSRVGKEVNVYTDYNFGPVLLAAAFDRQNGTSLASQNDKNERTVIGISAPVAGVRIAGGYESQRVLTIGKRVNNRLIWLSAVYEAGALTLTPAIYRWNPEGTTNSSTMFTVLASHALSKRTDFYTQLAYMKNQTNAVIGMAGPVNPGDNQAAITAGIRHRF